MASAAIVLLITILFKMSLKLKWSSTAWAVAFNKFSALFTGSTPPALVEPDLKNPSPALLLQLVLVVR